MVQNEINNLGFLTGEGKTNMSKVSTPSSVPALGQMLKGCLQMYFWVPFGSLVMALLLPVVTNYTQVKDYAEALERNVLVHACQAAGSDIKL